MKACSPKNKTLRLGVSSCLLGEKVRFDGGHKKNDFLIEGLSPYVEWVSICPEVEVGLGIPRDALHLEEREGQARLIQTKNSQDLTKAMQVYARKKILELRSQNLSGYILKKNSPSCGMERVKIYSKDRKGIPQRKGQGLFASALQIAFPSLPMEEEGRLADPLLRENFVERIFVYQRLQELFHSKWIMSDLILFHTQHKLSLMAHSPEIYRVLGSLVGEGKSMPRKELQELYQAKFMEAFKRLATPAKHANVLLHVLGFFKRFLDSDSKQELLSFIEDYRKGLLPLIVPITLVQHYVRRFKQDYLLQQSYLSPHPKELMLRNRI